MPKRPDIIAVYDNCNFPKPIEYTINLILSIYGVSYDIVPINEYAYNELDPFTKLIISYGTERIPAGSRKQIHIYASDFFGENYLNAKSIPKSPLPRHEELPIIYSGHGNLDGWINKSQNIIETNIDIIASTFFLVSRYEELILDSKDEHGRFPSKASLACRDGFLNKPVVNLYQDLLWQWICFLHPVLIRTPLWPHDRSFAVCLSHDVDRIKKYPPVAMLRSIVGRALHGRPREALYLAVMHMKTLLELAKDPYDTFDYIIRLEKSMGFKSSFYFMAGGTSQYDTGHTINSAPVKELVTRLEAEGFEVGLHPSYNSYDNINLLASEKNRFDRVIKNTDYGCRQHYIRWKSPETWRIQNKTGVLYDATLSYADHVGFRCGICVPFQPFDIVDNTTLNIWELPLTVMDGSLQKADYQKLIPEIAYQEMIYYINTVRKYNGVFVLLWHNSSFDAEGGWDGWKDVYEKVMRYIAGQNAWVTSGREIVEWWKKTRSLVGDSFRYPPK